ncbi:MAG: clostripain family protease [Bacteroidales bacterium]|nr:clostripain family protease [Bacteroidales bacterium]
MKRHNIYSLTIFLLLLLTAFSCSKDPKVEPVVPKGRTILVYVALDNSLSSEMVDVHASLMQGWKNSSKEGSLILFADSRGDEKPLLIQIKEHKGVVIADTLLRYDNDNSASPELLSRVIADTKLIAPGDSYGLLLFSHATGWLPAKAFSNPGAWGIAVANSEVPTLQSIFEDNGREMEFADFAAAIPDGMFEFIASEMCFMSSVETAYALRNKTKYLLAAAPEVLSPGFEPIYKTSLDLLFKPTPDLEGFALKFFDYFNGLQGAYQSAAISVVKTSEMQALANYTSKINLALTQDQIDKVQIYDRNGRPNVFFDFRDYVAQTATTKEMDQLDVLLDKAVIFKRSTPKLINIYIPKHSGLSVYIPQAGLPRLNKAYEDTEWYKAVDN